MSRFPAGVAVLSAVLFVVPVVSAQNRGPMEEQRARQEEVNRLQGELTAARARLSAIQAAVRAKFETRDDYRALQAEIRQAQREFEQAREPVIAKLRQSEEYKRASEEARLASERVERQREGNPTTQPTNPEPIEQSLLDAITEKMEQKSDISRMEAKAIEQDEGARRAQERVKAASAKLNAIQTEYRAALLANPDWVVARDEVLAAQARMTGQAGGTGMGGRGQSSFNNNNVNPGAGSVVPGGPTQGPNPGGFVPGGTGLGEQPGVGVVPPPATQPSTTNPRN